jgi:nucleoside-diphosphate-sugar epimerase
VNILVLGGCGYVGSVLVTDLLKSGNHVRVIDACWFGNYLDDHEKLEVIVKDIRDIQKEDILGVDVIVHLANIANDPAVDLAPVLSWEVNVLAFNNILSLAESVSIGRLIYASSGSVYGVSQLPDVFETNPLVPLTYYNKTKIIAERLALSYKDDLDIVIIRPSSVFGVSPRTRLDLALNAMAYSAVSSGKIVVNGGNQVRPNIHIQDLSRVYQMFLDADVTSGEIFNAGFYNNTILSLAEQISDLVSNVEIEVEGSDDPRSYYQNSSKLLSSGFSPEYSIRDGIEEIQDAFLDGSLKANDDSYTVKKMLSLGIE